MLFWTVLGYLACITNDIQEATKLFAQAARLQEAVGEPFGAMAWRLGLVHTETYAKEQFLRHLPAPERIATIVEVGARDCMSSLQLATHFSNAHVYAFECNPDVLPACEVVTSAVPNLTLVRQAASDRTGALSFNVVDPTLGDNKNLGASSIFEIQIKEGSGAARYGLRKETVSSTRLDDFMAAQGIARIDYLCMDVQGAELLVLKGLGDRIAQVGHVLTEAQVESDYPEWYPDGCSYDELRRHMIEQGFEEIEVEHNGADVNALFRNRR